MKESGTHYRTVVEVHQEKMEKQIGCMSSFLQIFDRQQLLAGKRIHSTKRLPPSTLVGASPETKSSGESQVIIPPSPYNSQSSPVEKTTGRSKSLSSKEMHRHSLDSRVTVNKTSVADEDENRRRSPSVIARLMGLEPLSSTEQKTQQTVTKPSLQRSASESRLSRDQVHSKYIDDNNFQLKHPNKSAKQTTSNRDNRNGKEASRTTSPWRSRSLYDSGDFFPEQNQKLKMREIDEQSIDDISTLKQILEVLQLKGLLRSTNHLSNNNSHRNYVYDQNLRFNESNIVLVKPIRPSASKADNQRSVNDSGATRKYVSENSLAISPKREGGVRVRVRTSSSPNRIENILNACNSINKTKQSSNGIQRKDDKKISSNDSPKLTPKRNESDHHSSINRSFRNQKLTESSTERILSTSSKTDSERSKWEGCREGKNSTTESPLSSATVLPSPVSVLDSGFDKDELLTPLHCIDLKATAAINHNVDNGNPKLSPKISTQHEEFTSDDSDFTYISHILQASQHLHEDPSLFLSIEKHLYNNKNTSNITKRHRKLIFDVVHEIFNRNRQLPPWKTLIKDHGPPVKQIWSEFQKIRDVNTGDGVLELVSGVIEKDLVKNSDWRDYPIETSEVVLDVERMIFKDLVSEVIRDLVEFSGECMFFRTRRRLVF